jgi:hypothetical protein
MYAGRRWTKSCYNGAEGVVYAWCMDVYVVWASNTVKCYECRQALYKRGVWKCMLNGRLTRSNAMYVGRRWTKSVLGQRGR